MSSSSSDKVTINASSSSSRVKHAAAAMGAAFSAKTGAVASESKEQPCPNCRSPLRAGADRIYECPCCGKRFMNSASTAAAAAAAKVDKPLASSQESNRGEPRRGPPRRRAEPEIIAIDDSDEEPAAVDAAAKLLLKRKTDVEWPPVERSKLARNDENASAVVPTKQTTTEIVTRRADVAAAGGLTPRNGNEPAGVRSPAAASAHVLDMLGRDWGVRPSDLVSTAAPVAKSAKAALPATLLMPLKYLSLSTYVNTDVETCLELSDANGLSLKVTDDGSLISIIIGSDDLQYALVAFHEPLYMLMLKVTRKFADLFHLYLSQLGQYGRDESDVSDTRIVILFNLKKPEAVSGLFNVVSFLTNLFRGEETPARAAALPNRVFSLGLSKTYECAQKLFLDVELPELKKFHKKYQGQVQPITLVNKYPSAEDSDAATLMLSDLNCLQDGEFLNDNIIRFYLKYLQTAILAPADKARFHIFDTFFYHRLTSKSQKSKSEAEMSAAERRHNRVKKWTRNVNIFEKDFLIVPINKNAHWNLAIVCYPYLLEPVYREANGHDSAAAGFDDESAVGEQEEETRPVRRRTAPSRTNAGAEIALDAESSDEAEPSAEDLSADLSALSIDKDKICCKLPTILIFDSLPSAKQHKRVIATLREYIECEYAAKYNEAYGVKLYGATVAAPTQNNYFDCGIYLLHYVECFFKRPLDKFNFPINLRDWFPRRAIEEKRQRIKTIIFGIQEAQTRAAIGEATPRARANLLHDLQSMQ